MSSSDFARSEMSSRILADLSTRQFLQPHHDLAGVLRDAQLDLGFCPRAGEAALDWLSLDPQSPIGRLRRSELIQLARCIHRFWRQALSAETAQPQPA